MKGSLFFKLKQVHFHEIFVLYLPFQVNKLLVSLKEWLIIQILLFFIQIILFFIVDSTFNPSIFVEKSLIVQNFSSKRLILEDLTSLGGPLCSKKLCGACREFACSFLSHYFISLRLFFTCLSCKDSEIFFLYLRSSSACFRF